MIAQSLMLLINIPSRVFKHQGATNETSISRDETVQWKYNQTNFERNLAVVIYFI